MRRAKRASTDENCTGSKPWPLALTQSAITCDIHGQNKSKSKAHPLAANDSVGFRLTGSIYSAVAPIAPEDGPFPTGSQPSLPAYVR